MERRKNNRIAIEYDLVLFIKAENDNFRPYHILDLNEDGLKFVTKNELFIAGRDVVVSFESNRKKIEVTSTVSWLKKVGKLESEKTNYLVVGVQFKKAIPSNLISEYLFLSFTSSSLNKAA